MSDAWSRPVFLVGLGRTGSTLLQRLLNLHGGLTIWGEHGAFLKGFASAHRLVVDHPSHSPNVLRGYEARHNVIGELDDPTVFQPWVSPFRPADVGDAFRSVLVDLFTEGLDPTTRWGFKEVRYIARDLEPLLELFPEAHVVVVVREFEDWAPSRFFAFGRPNDFGTGEGVAEVERVIAEMEQSWCETYSGFADLADARPTQVTVVDYAGLRDPATTIRLFGRLDETAPDEDRLRSVIDAKAGSTFASATAAERRPAFESVLAGAPIDRDAIRALHHRLTGG